MIQAQIPDSSTAIIVQIISTLPALLWFVFFVIIFTMFYKRIREDLFPRINKVAMFGVDIAFVGQELDRGIEESNAQVSQQERSQVLRRAQGLAPILRGASLLWVDDNPENNRTEQRILRTLGIKIDEARSTDAGLKMLSQSSYDALISDMNRNIPDAGLQLLKEARERGYKLPVIFYTGYADPTRGTPPYALGIADQPAELLHYVFDALERQRR